MNETRCFFFGLSIGAIAGLLMAPRSGDRTRKQIAETAREGQNYVMGRGVELKESVVDKLNRTKRAAQATADGIGAAFEAGKEQLVG